mmetsp:Transcript_16910/g.26937  ORF Transcript_16910/g.26937 Transcript_16910/m.26937 type:complete len:262 (-) Transcript_16910:100-885(-)
MQPQSNDFGNGVQFAWILGLFVCFLLLTLPFVSVVGIRVVVIIVGIIRSSIVRTAAVILRSRIQHLLLFTATVPRSHWQRLVKASIVLFIVLQRRTALLGHIVIVILVVFVKIGKVEAHIVESIVDGLLIHMVIFRLLPRFQLLHSLHLVHHLDARDILKRHINDRHLLFQSIDLRSSNQRNGFGVERHANIAAAHAACNLHQFAFLVFFFLLFLLFIFLRLLFFFRIPQFLQLCLHMFQVLRHIELVQWALIFIAKQPTP